MTTEYIGMKYKLYMTEHNYMDMTLTFYFKINPENRNTHYDLDPWFHS